MPCGLFGKLPMKRDFISVETPREFLQVWEAWLQGGIAASRIALGSNWRDVFLRAPIWRFWMAPEICGRPVMGSFMASVDGVGRFFPLTVIAFGGGDEAFAPPTTEPHDSWFSEVEGFLLDALEEGAQYDACLEKLRALPVPPLAEPAAPADEVLDSHRALIAQAADVDGLPDAFKAALAERDRRMYSGASFWWTIGGDDYAPRAIFAEGLPDPNIVTALLSGRFESESGN